MTNTEAIKILDDLRSYDYDKIYELYQDEPMTLTDALNMAIKALQEQADNIPVMYYPQVDGITPTVVAQADGEKTCGTCRNEDTYHCAECENKSDYEQAQADTIPREAVKDVSYDGGDNWWVKNMREQIKAQADGEYISKTSVLDTLYNFSVEHGKDYERVRKHINELPSVAIPPDHDGCEDCRWQSQSETEMPCKQCMHNYTDEWERAKIGHWIWQTEDIYQCSECGEDIHVKEVMNKPQYICCPICGCPMEIER